VERASSSNDAFELLGLPAQFDLDPQVIERAFFERSKELHPDRFATAPAAERVAALSRSRALNDAYQAVKKPVPRAEYLLARAGVAIGDNERLDSDFLGRVLELREELAEARATGDRGKLGELESAMAKRRAVAIEELAAAFVRGQLADAKRVVMSLRYIDRYLEECDAALDEED
jgi:molecular chaperone HscB